jgi:hypothetical protein
MILLFLLLYLRVACVCVIPHCYLMIAMMVKHKLRCHATAQQHVGQDEYRMHFAAFVHQTNDVCM